MVSQPEQLRERTKQFALRIVRLFRSLPKTDLAWTVGKQLLRSGTSVAANYRAVCRARSRAEFVAKMGIVLEEADETAYWLEPHIDADVVPKQKLASLVNEANEFVRIFAASRRTAGARRVFQSLNRPITQ
jgi:four helix bundle protein